VFIAVQFPRPLSSGTLIRRYKRFLADIQLDQGDLITAYCANTGPLTGLTAPGTRVWVSPRPPSATGLEWTWEIACDQGTYVGVNTQRPNQLAKQALMDPDMPWPFGPILSIQPEIKVLDSRLDFGILTAQVTLFMEVKNVHMKRDGQACFPDAVTTRGARHLNTLRALAQQGHHVIMLYTVQRSDCPSLCFARDIDPVYADTFYELFQSGASSRLALNPLCPTMQTLRSILHQDACNQGEQLHEHNQGQQPHNPEHNQGEQAHTHEHSQAPEGARGEQFLCLKTAQNTAPDTESAPDSMAKSGAHSQTSCTQNASLLTHPQGQDAKPSASMLYQPAAWADSENATQDWEHRFHAYALAYHVTPQGIALDSFIPIVDADGKVFLHTDTSDEFVSDTDISDKCVADGCTSDEVVSDTCAFDEVLSHALGATDAAILDSMASMFSSSLSESDATLHAVTTHAPSSMDLASSQAASSHSLSADITSSHAASADSKTSLCAHPNFLSHTPLASPSFPPFSKRSKPCPKRL
jgi:sugar fermentation stimulation protein A